MTGAISRKEKKMAKKLKAVITVKGKKTRIISDKVAHMLYQKAFSKDLMKTLANYQDVEFYDTPENEREIKRMMWAFLKRSNPFTPTFEKWEQQFTANEAYEMFTEASKVFLISRAKGEFE